MIENLREDELSKLLSVTKGAGSDTVVVTGPAGSGRTTLLAAVAEATTISTSVVRANPTERQWRLSGLSAFLAAVDDAVGTNLRSLITVSTDERSTFTVAEDLDTLLRKRTFDPFAVIIDDADLIDSASLEVIGYLLRRRSIKNLRAILSVRSIGGSGPLSSFTRVVLSPLKVESLIELGLSSTSPLVWKSVLEIVARSSAGNPRSFESLLSAIRPGALHENEALTLPLRPGQELQEIVGRPLEGCSAQMPDGLRVISCAAYTPTRVLEPVAQVDEGCVEDLVKEGLVRQLRHGVEVSDPRIRSVVYYSMTEAERHRIHAAIVDALTDDDTVLRAWHSIFTAIDAATSAGLFACATECVRDGRILHGVELAERAILLSAGPADHSTVEGLTTALMTQCQYTLARRYLRFLQGRTGTDEVSPSVLRLRILIDNAELNVINDQNVIRVVERNAATAPDACARLLASTGFCYLQQWDTESARTTASRISALLGSDAELAQVVEEVVGLFDAAVNGRSLPSVEELVATGERIRKSFAVESSWIVIAQTLSLADRFDEARAVLSNFFDQSSHLTPVWARFSRVVAFANESRAGNYHRVRELDELLTAGNDHHESVSVNDHIRTAMMAVLDGHSELAHSAVHDARRLTAQGSSRLLRCRLATIEARIAMQEGDFASANRHFARCHRLSTWLPSPHLLRYLDDFIESLVYVGDITKAKRILAELEQAQRDVPMTWTASAAARSRALLMSGDESWREFSRLLDSWTSPELEYVRGRTFLAYSHKLKELGYNADSEEMKAMGKSVLTDIGFGDARVVGETHADSSQSLIDSLNDKELPVVELLTQGYKNHVIAHELFVSVRTVELRLTNIYRKVGVKSRFELLRALDQENRTRSEGE
ncbi:LuxR family transcriptional regulator [Brevibacterium sp. 'Marine']|uniref:LuxR family transcriptional regulator n=1 Tax=Brevibacterium sp. 'Marine' TaxID=2725563 RepID=UPI00145FB53D|nr:LuxR family transcriptional regulator [Brevibacterium sp. 'Marine']